MPVQTTKTSYLYFPDGAAVSVQPGQTGAFFEVGATNSAVTATLNWVENQVETANAGKTDKQIKEMTVEGGFTLINLDPEGVEKMGAGIFERITTAASPLATIPDQVVSSGWADNTKYDLTMETSSSDTTLLKVTAQPTLTAVTLDLGGTPEVLAEDTEYVVVADSSSYSGWSIQFISGNMATGSPTTFDITIDYGSNTPVASTAIYVGTSTSVLTAYAMRITHTDTNSKIRQLDLYSVDPNSGGFNFSFKGANEDGLEEMPLTFTAKLDTSLTDGRQLMAWTTEEGAA